MHNFVLFGWLVHDDPVQDVCPSPPATCSSQARAPSTDVHGLQVAMLLHTMACDG